MENLPVPTKPAAIMLEKSLPAMIKAYPSDNEAKRERFAQIAMTIANSVELKDCQDKSVVMAIYGCMKLGLVPDPSLGHVYIIPRWFKKLKCTLAQIQIGYRGYIELANRSQAIAETHSTIVYERDEFDEDLGTNRRVIHRPWYVKGESEPGEMRLAYVTWRDLRSGNVQHHVVTKNRIDRAREMSQSANSKFPQFSPWNKDEPAMWRKTAIIDASKMWPLTTEIADAVALDEQADLGRVQIIDAHQLPMPGDIDPETGDDPLLLDAEVEPTPTPEDPPGTDDPETSDASDATVEGVSDEEAEAIRQQEIAESQSD